jgi:hypothetical protein
MQEVSGTLVWTSLLPGDSTHSATVHEHASNKLLDLMTGDPLPWPKEIVTGESAISSKEKLYHALNMNNTSLAGQQQHGHCIDGSADTRDAWNDSEVRSSCPIHSSYTPFDSIPSRLTN